MRYTMMGSTLKALGKVRPVMVKPLLDVLEVETERLILPAALFDEHFLELVPGQRLRSLDDEVGLARHGGVARLLASMAVGVEGNSQSASAT